jgi:signal peptidase
METREPKSMNYIGTSMSPVLKTGDRLQVNPYNRQEIRRGDVVTFIPPGGDSKIVHRVISVNSDGIKTRGDNCDYEDDWVLKRENILGRVVAAQREKRRWRVFGGPMGQLFAAVLRVIHVIDLGFSCLLHPVYKRLSRSDIFRRWLPSRMRPRVISFNRDSGTEMQLVMGRKVIGRRLPGKTGWNIRRPFRLFVDEKSLPENLAEISGVRCQ